MALPFDENTVSYCDYLGSAQDPQELFGVRVNFDDGTSILLQGDEIAEELLAMCRSKNPPI